jgi:voltage-gated sodium channel
LFFVSFVLIGTMVIMNLFIGVIMTSMEEAKQEANQDTALGRIQKRVEALQGTAGNTELLNEIRSLSGKVDVLKSEVERLRDQGKD